MKFKSKIFWAVLTIIMGATEIATASKDIYDAAKLKKALEPKKLSDPVVEKEGDQ
jgi:hypothetical protein